MLTRKTLVFKTLLLVMTWYFATSFQTTQTPLVKLVEPPEFLAVNSFTKIEFEQSMQTFYQSLKADKYDLNFKAFNYAMMGYYSMLGQNKLANERYVSIIDFTKPSNEKRFYTIDLNQMKIIYHTYVAHGRNTGTVYAEKFSDVPQSHQSSMGFYVTGKTYMGNKGFSLKLHGDEAGYNKNMYDRGIVIHTADYVSDDIARAQGRLGRSWGCPVLPETVYKPIIYKIKNGSMIFAYYDDPTYLRTSKYLNTEEALAVFRAQNHSRFSA